MGMALNSGIGSQIGQAGLGQSPIQSQSAPQQGFGMPAQGYDPTIDPATGMPMQMPGGPQMGFGMPPGVLNQDPGPGGFQNPAAQPMPTSGQGGGKAGLFSGIANQVGNFAAPALNQIVPGAGNILGSQLGSQLGNILSGGMQQPAPQGPQQGFGMPPGGMPQQQPSPQMGFGMPAGGLYGRDLSGNSGVSQMMGGMGTMASQPVNRFAPPNAPGVRTAQPMARPAPRPQPMARPAPRPMARPAASAALSRGQAPRIR